MARDPGSIWKPLPEAGAPDGHTKTQFIVHSTGTLATAAANWNYFNRADVVVESTFIVGWGPDDPTLQIMDSTDNADANGSANRRGISVEVVGDGVGGYNAWQVKELIRLGIWARRVHGITPRIIPTEPAGGYGWHVMFGAPGPWTTVRGKVCPGNRRIQQLKDTVFPAIFAGTPVEDDMPSMDEFLNYPAYVGGPSISQYFKDLHHRTRDVVRSSTGKPVEMIQEIADAKTIGLQLVGQVAGLSEALKQLAANPGQAVDLAAVQAAAKAGAEEALAKGVDVDITVGGQSAS